MRFISLFSGIGGFDLAFERAGMKCVAVCEIDKNAQSVLRRHFPKAELFDDVRKVGKNTHEPNSIDVLCGGFPCQDLSIAGKREGLAGERSGLWFEFHRIIKELKPRWVVIENVPGLLSSNKGQDFAIILQGLGECGYRYAYRVLDAQYFGVPQRRRRVFIVASLGNGSCAEVLFEREGSAGNTPKSSESQKASAGTFTVRSGKDGGGKGYLGQESLPMTLGGQPQWAYNIQQNDGGSHKRKDRPNGGMYIKETDTSLTVGTTDQTLITTVSGKETYPTLTASQSEKQWLGNQEAFSGDYFIWDAQQETSKAHRTKLQSKLSYTLNGSGNMMIGVRRLTPLECERLQGFPDGWTDGQSDSARYKQLGNAVAVPVVEWIGRRIWKSAAQQTIT